MSGSPRRQRYSRSPSPRRGRSRSRSPAYNRGYRDGHGEGRDGPVKEEEINSNPGNNLYVTGLSTRVTEKDLEEYFAKEGKVAECRLVVDPRSHESRGFGFVTMETAEDAERSIKRLHHSNLEGRIITVEKARRSRARTPTPGKYLGSRMAAGAGGGRSWGGVEAVLLAATMNEIIVMTTTVVTVVATTAAHDGHLVTPLIEGGMTDHRATLRIDITVVAMIGHRIIPVGKGTAHHHHTIIADWSRLL